MAFLFLILFFAALIGVFRPYKFAPQFGRKHYGLTAFIAFILIGVTAPTSVPTKREGATPLAGNSGSMPLVSDQTQATPSLAATSQWVYNERKDEMRAATERFAQLDAEGTIRLDFPYGEQRGQVLIRQSPQFGFDILVGVPSGQIMCHSYSGGHINVKFDEGPIERFACTDASDGTSNMVFVRNSKGLLAKLKKSKRLVVEAEFFQNGMQQMVFNTEGLKWE